MKNYDMILTEKQRNLLLALLSRKIDKYEYLTGEKYYLLIKVE